MKYTPWPKRDPVKNYFQLPNEIFLLGLSPGALAVYSYLLCCEDRNTYQCWPSYKTIGRAVKMSANTVRPIQLALDQFYNQQLAQMDVAVERQRVAKALALRRDKCSSA